MSGATLQAKASDRSWVLVRALRRHLMTEAADILAVVEGRAQIAEGDAHDMDDALNEIDRIIRKPADVA